jgi:hypothetical protein
MFGVTSDRFEAHVPAENVHKIVLWRIDPLLRGDYKQQPLLWSTHSLRVRSDVTTIEEVMQAVFSVGPL